MKENNSRFHKTLFRSFHILTNKIHKLKYNKTDNKTHFISGTKLYKFGTKMPSSGSLLKTKDLSPTRTSGTIRPHFHHKGDSIIKKAVSQLYVQGGHS